MYNKNYNRDNSKEISAVHILFISHTSLTIDKLWKYIKKTENASFSRKGMWHYESKELLYVILLTEKLISCACSH